MPCWQWLDFNFSKTYAGIPVSITVPPYGVYMGNDGRSAQNRIGPNSIPWPYSPCEVTAVAHVSMAIAKLANRMVTASVAGNGPVLIEVTANGSPTQGAQVLRRPESGSEVNPLGRTDANGQLSAYDVAVGDTLVARNQGWEINHLVSQADLPGPIELASPLTVKPHDVTANGSQANLPLGIIVSGQVASGMPYILSLRLQSSMALAAAPTVTLHVNNGIGQNVVLSPVNSLEYTGSVAIAASQVGTVEIACQGTNGVTLATTDQYQVGEANAATATTLWSSDGMADIHSPAGAVPTNCLAMVYSGFAPTIFPAGFSKVLVGPVLSVYQGAASSLNGTNGVVNIGYRDADVAGVDETSIKLYHWNGTARQWELQPSGVSVDANVVSASVTNFGVLALFADPTTDVTPPGAITNLSVTTGTNGWNVVASWTATGDDGNTGTATAYVLKFSTQAITASNWDTCATLALHHSPQPAGTVEQVQIQMPDPGVTYYFAIRAVDEAGNLGQLGKVVTAQSHQYDSDGDGMPDQWEITYGLNPTNSADAAQDADGDGLTNLQEYQLGTNPTAWDTDGDGMSDGWEVVNGLNPLSAADANLDPDGDGLSNLQEYLSGRNPNVYDTLRLKDCHLQPDGTLTISANGEAGRIYTMEVSTNLVNWTSQGLLAFTNTTMVVSGPAVTNAPMRFYRLRQ
jgi:hypothetical protein